MPSLKGTQTEKNLLASFAGESQARNRYTFFAKQAKKEGYEQISGIFLETAANEEQHAKTFFKFLEGGDLEITATYPAGKIGTTAENLEAAAMGEHEEFSVIYPEAAEVAEKEGFPKIAAVFRNIAKVEAHHEERYRKLLENVKNNTVFKKSEAKTWICRKCGHVHVGEEPPANCPSCDHPTSYFEILTEEY